jgi:hypothetical protein
VVADQIGNPTSALDIADGVLKVAANLLADGQAPRGIFHMTGSGEASWADFAEAIFAASAGVGGPSAKVNHTAPAITPHRRHAPPIRGWIAPRCKPPMACACPIGGPAPPGGAAGERKGTGMKGIILAGGSGTRLYPMTLSSASS